MPFSALLPFLDSVVESETQTKNPVLHLTLLTFTNYANLAFFLSLQKVSHYNTCITFVLPASRQPYKPWAYITTQCLKGDSFHWFTKTRLNCLHAVMK